MNKGLKKALIIVVILILLIVISGTIYYCFNNRENISTKKVDNGIQIKGFEYVLYKTHPKLYKSEFKLLKSNLESETIDYNEYANSIGKMFLIDLYNLDNKKNMYDVGGVVFVYPDARENYKLNVSNTLYKYMKDNTMGKRKQKLPIVKSVSLISSEDNKFKIDEKEYEGYKLKYKIEYKEDLGYDTDCEIITIKKDKYLYIVEKNNIEQKNS